MEPELIEARAQVKEMNKDLKLFWIPCGNMDFLLEKNELAHATMTKLGIKIMNTSSPREIITHGRSGDAT